MMTLATNIHIAQGRIVRASGRLLSLDKWLEAFDRGFTLFETLERAQREPYIGFERLFAAICMFSTHFNLYRRLSITLSEFSVSTSHSFFRQSQCVRTRVRIAVGGRLEVD